MAHTPDLGSSSCLDDIAAKLREALGAARTIGLHSDDEFVIQAERAFMLLSQREARAATRDQLARLLEEFYKECPLRTTNLETMQKWKQDINDALMAARASNFGEADIKEAELCRRRVHNRIEDLKGQVRVLCRVRPRTGAEESRGRRGGGRCQGGGAGTGGEARRKVWDQDGRDCCQEKGRALGRDLWQGDER